jgi:hypothetical protein
VLRASLSRAKEEGGVVEMAWLAATVVGKFLVPLFTKGNDQLTDELGESWGRAAADSLVKAAGTIWKRIKSRFDRDDEKKTADLFEKNPRAMEKMLIELLEKRLEEDADFRQEIQQLIEAPTADTGCTSWELMGQYVGAVDARNSIISGATVAGVFISRGGSADPPLAGSSNKS